MSENEVFDARIKVPFSCIIAGAPFSGKTTFVAKLLEERNRLIDKPLDYIAWFYGQENDTVKK